MQNMMTGVDGSIDDASKPRSDDPCPSWKTNTSAPNDALIDSRFITTALRGSTTEPSSTKSTIIVASITNATACGV